MMDLATNWTSCDDSFGLTAGGCETPRFDFTLFFEQSILNITPCALLLIVSLPRTVYLFRSKPKVLRNRIAIPKLVGAPLILACQSY